MNEFTLIGTLLSVGPLEETSSGIKVVNFYVKVEKTFKANVTHEEFKVTAFKDLAEEISSKKKIGNDLFIRGRLQANNYSSNGKTYYSPELLAEKVMYIVR